MTFDKSSLLLYAVTDRTWLGEETLCDQVEKSLRGGVSFVQLREKDLAQETLLEDVGDLKHLCKTYGVPFVINDHVELALHLDADGVHVGQGDMEAAQLRPLLGTSKIIGVSVSTVAQAIRAEASGADYLGVGAIFGTATKTDASDVSMETLKAICEAVSIPVVAIGGISAARIPELRGSGISGVAVVSAIFAEADIEAAARALHQVCREVF